MKELLHLVVAVLATTGQFANCWAASQREGKPRFKGVELYSWKDERGVWIFALVDGTNESKTLEDVKTTKRSVKGAEELKKALARLAEGEHVSWTHPMEGLEFPPEATRIDIEQAAMRAKVELVIDRREAPPRREAKPRFKGVELYSWKGEGGAWVFALLDGTNALKNPDRVKEPRNAIKGAEELKKALGRLAEGERVSWTHRIAGFEFPPEDVQKELSEAASRAKVELVIPGSRGTKPGN